MKELARGLLGEIRESWWAGRPPRLYVVTADGATTEVVFPELRDLPQTHRYDALSAVLRRRGAVAATVALEMVMNEAGMRLVVIAGNRMNCAVFHSDIDTRADEWVEVEECPVGPIIDAIRDGCVELLLN